MKYSGVEWIGNIPDNWCAIKLKHFLVLYGSGGTPDSSNESFYDQNGTPWVVISDISNSEYIYKTEKCVTKAGIDDKRLTLYPPGTILYAMYASVGKVAELKVQATVNQAILALVFNNNRIINEFSKYCLCAYEPFALSQSNGTTQFNMNANKVLNIFMVCPPAFEQRKIVDFLNKKLNKIDSLIEIENKQIEKLKEYKQAIITDAVTKGLYKNVSMKNSGIEWISNIPEGWTIQKILNQLAMPVTDGPHTTPELLPEGIAFVSAEAVSCGNGKIDFSHIRGYISEDFYNECCLKYIPKIDDVYMIKSGATTGKVSIVDSLEPKFTIWSPIAVMRCNREKMLPKFLYYAVQSEFFQRQIVLGWSFGTQQNLGMRTLEQLKLIVPNIDCQRLIVDYLDNKVEMINQIIELKQQKIDKLNEFKKSLIYEYVTGKKEVLL